VRAAVLKEVGQPLTLEEVELAEPGPGEVSVRLSASGVCHSDWNVATGATANLEATRSALAAGREGLPALDDLLALKDEPANPFFRRG
jgi:Zn-dependent alcohol dehydrogenase